MTSDMSRLTVTAREAVRHGLFTVGAYRALTWLRGRRGAATGHLQAMDTKSRFQAIYDTGVWGKVTDGTPESGPGSALSATSTLRQTLPLLLNELGAKTLLDVGCGDFMWMQHVNLAQKYIGVDVVDRVISANKEQFEDSNRTFMSLDAIADELPSADVVMCREILFHLSFKDINRLLRNVFSKERSFIVVTSDRQTNFNSDIPTGDFRPLNLEVRPFGFPAPIRVIDDSAVRAGRIIGVWAVKDLPRP